MQKLNTHSYSWEGHWRLPDLQERHPGVLTYSPGDGFVLKLLSEGFESPYVEMDVPTVRLEGGGGKSIGLRGSIYQAVYGEADGRFITIFNVMSIESFRKHGAQAASAKSTYKASGVVEGAHISSEDSAVIKSASVSIDNLHRWLGEPEELSVMSSYSEDPVHRVHFAEVRTGRKLGPKRGATLADGTAVTISRNWILPSLRWSTNSYESQAQEFAQVEFDPPKQWSLMDVRKHAWEMSSLISLALDRPCASHAIDLVVQQDSLKDQRASYITHRTTGENSEEFVIRHEPSNFTCSEVRFEEVIPAWFAFCQKHGAMLNLFTTLKTGTVDYLETSVFLAAILAEAFHKAVFGKKNSITPEAKSIAEEIFPEDTNPHSLFKRLVDLYCRAPEAVALALIPDIKAWSREHVEARNSISHEAGLGEASPHSAWAAAQVTLALVTAHILVTGGVSGTTIERALTESPTFRKAIYSSEKYLNMNA